MKKKEQSGTAGNVLHSQVVKNRDFVKGLEAGDLDLLTRSEKADLHNHASLGYRKVKLEEWMDTTFPDAPERMEDFIQFADYLNRHFHPIIYSRKGFEFSIRAALLQAKEDNVTLLEMSTDSQVVHLYNDGAEGLARFLNMAHMETAPEIRFKPDIGMNRELDVNVLSERILPMIDSGYFTGIDLYGNEFEGPPERFKEIFRYAGKKGLKLKAHAGEYQPAEFVRHSVDVLELDEVQHGISSVQDKEVLSWLRRQNVRLNICPTSNLRLCRVISIGDHPIRPIADAGVPVTINSDDILVFDQSVSEEYLLLYQEGVFTAEELDILRKESLKANQ